ncbi:MAG: hypothetical protein JWO91_886 [Acidobacteriaceae bacterium]|nr:hypothetical protein [Acidobacteriaceae bacterium]
MTRRNSDGMRVALQEIDNCPRRNRRLQRRIEAYSTLDNDSVIAVELAVRKEENL